MILNRVWNRPGFCFNRPKFVPKSLRSHGVPRKVSVMCLGAIVSIFRRIVRFLRSCGLLLEGFGLDFGRSWVPKSRQDCKASPNRFPASALVNSFLECFLDAFSDWFWFHFPPNLDTQEHDFKKTLCANDIDVKSVWPTCLHLAIFLHTCLQMSQNQISLLSIESSKAVLICHIVNQTQQNCVAINHQIRLLSSLNFGVLYSKNQLF